MKILYHHRTASKDGQAVHIEELIAALREQGHEVRVVAPAAPAEGRMDAGDTWVQKLRRALPGMLAELAELGYSWLAYRRLMRAARDFRPDVIYERCNLFLVAGVMAKRRLGVPLLLEVNSPLAHEREKFGGLALPRLARWSEHTAWLGADAVLPVTRVLADMLAAEGVPQQHLHVLPNGINEAHFAKASSKSDAKARLGWADALVLGFTGFVRDWHGVDRVLRWMATQAAPANARLLVVGDGPARSELEALAAQLGLTDRMRFTGVVHRDAVPDLVAAFDIALQPAVTPYASPLKLMEYLALGKAVIAPAMPNIEEVLTDDVNAVLFDPASPDDFARVLTRLAADAALRDRLAAKARASIGEQGLTWARNAARVAKLAAELKSGQALAVPAAGAQRG